MAWRSDQWAEIYENMPVEELIWTPDHPLFYHVLHSTPPPNAPKRDVNLCVRAGSEVLEPLNDAELAEYLFGGEWEEVTEDQESPISYEEFDYDFG